MSDIRDWLSQAVQRMRMPEAPVRENWDCSAAALIRPHLPQSIRRVPGLLDRFGAVRLTPVEIGIDSTRAVPWTAVLEVQTRPLLDVVATAVSTNFDKQVSRMVPPIPGVKFAARIVTSRLAEYTEDTVATLLLVALREHRGDMQVPCQVVYRKRWKSHVLFPGLVSSAVLCLPQVANSLLATARQHQIRVTANPPAVSLDRLQKLVEKLHKHRAGQEDEDQPATGHPYVDEYRDANAQPGTPESIAETTTPVRRSSLAPQLNDSYFSDLLARAGFPCTAHNLFAVQEQIGIMFTTKAWQAMEQLGTEADWRRFLSTACYPTESMHLWPQRVLDAIADWDARIAPHIQDLPQRYAEILLEDVGRNNGSFFGGSPDVPLLTANAWKMKGLKQPDARPMAAPR